MREKELFFKLLLVSVMLLMTVTGRAQSHGNRLSLGFGALYESGLDATLAVEHETKSGTFKKQVRQFASWCQCRQ